MKPKHWFRNLMRAAVTALACTAAPAFFLAGSTSANDTAIDSDLSEQQRAKIDALFEEYDTSVSPGCAAGVMRNGRLAYARGFGLADLERHVRITPATLFDIASTSKQFTAGAVLLLELDGKLALSDEVRKYIPELPDYGAPITIDHLMRHTSGLRDYIPQMSLIGLEEEAVSNEQTLALIARQRELNFPTGSRYEYSNTGYFLLSVIVKRVSGKSLAEFARERILLPLGMTHSRYQEEYDMIIPDRALGYARDDKGGFRHSLSNWEQTGDGSLHLSIEEALQWDRNFYQPRVGGQAFVERLQEPGKLANGKTITYARGMVVDEYRGLTRVHHGGAWVGYNSMYARFPGQHTSIAVFCNLEGAVGSRADQIADIVLADVLGAAEPAPAAPQSGSRQKSLPHQRFLGTYLEVEETAIFDVLDKEGTLTLKLSTTPMPLTPVGRARFAVQGSPATVEFSIADQGPASSLRLQLGSNSAMTATRFTPATPSADDLQAYAGTFYSPELDVTWSIVIEEGHLAVRRETRKFISTIEPLEPALTDVFHGEPGVIRFRRDASGRLTGFDLSSWGRRGIRFELQARL